MKTAIFSIAALGISFGMAHAATFTYNLSDHPEGNAAGDYDYGLRLDREQPIARFFSFSNGDGAILTYDDVAGTAEISGSVRESLMGQIDGGLFTISYSMSGLDDLGDGGFLDFAGNGTGFVTDGTTTLNFDAAANDTGLFLVFSDDDPNVPNYRGVANGEFVGHGWVQKMPGDNDFLFTATPVAAVPVPAGGFLMLAGLGGLALGARRKKAA